MCELGVVVVAYGLQVIFEGLGYDGQLMVICHTCIFNSLSRGIGLGLETFFLGESVNPFDDLGICVERRGIRVNHCQDNLVLGMCHLMVLLEKGLIVGFLDCSINDCEPCCFGILVTCCEQGLKFFGCGDGLGDFRGLFAHEYLQRRDRVK